MSWFMNISISLQIANIIRSIKTTVGGRRNKMDSVFVVGKISRWEIINILVELLYRRITHTVIKWRIVIILFVRKKFILQVFLKFVWDRFWTKTSIQRQWLFKMLMIPKYFNITSCLIVEKTCILPESDLNFYNREYFIEKLIPTVRKLQLSSIVQYYYYLTFYSLYFGNFSNFRFYRPV